MSQATPGKVYLVGAGPGDPGLLTLKGAACLGSADVVVYDRLVDPRLLRHVPDRAEVIYAGKAAKNHALTQDEINALLAEKALEGKIVVRLKGGDPFVFGRGGEELEALNAAGVPYEVVPGVTAAIAAPAYAGIPVTHRGLSASFAVVTGHEDPSKPGSDVRWDKLATGVGTLVLLMGVENLAGIVEQLLAYGRPPETPIAVIRWGTWNRQETVTGTLATIVDNLQGRAFSPPAVIVVGETAGMRDRFRWFDNRPLFGKRVLVTRAREQASVLASQFEALGAETIEAPAIEIAEPEDFGPLDDALARLGSYDWVIFTSANGVEAVARRLARFGRDARAAAGVRVAAIGPATAEALRCRSIIPDYVPQQFLSEAVAAGLGDLGVEAARILLPRTDIVGEDLAQALSARGAQVEQVIAYRTVLAQALDPSVERLLRSGGIDIVTFASASTVRNLLALLKGDVGLLERSLIASIGPVTSKAARNAGLRVDVEAAEHTIPGLVQAIVEAVGPGR